MKKLSQCTLSPETQSMIAQTVGTDFATLQNMDDDQTTAYIENKLGEIGAYRVGKTIAEIDRRLDEISADRCL